MNTPDVDTPDIGLSDAWKRRLKTGGVIALGIGAVIGVLSVSVMSVGIGSTVIYAVAFVFALSFFPTVIGVMGSSTPGSGLVAKLHIALGAFAYNHHYLVQRENKWEWCPGSADRVFIDGEWREINRGKQNKSVLGWRPFGVLRDKQDGSMQDYRVDTHAEMDRDIATGDGGTVTRAGYTEESPPAVTGLDGKWVVDLKRVFSHGIREFGDIDLIETAEEIIERKQVDDSRMGDYRHAVTFIAALILGLIAGYVYVFV